MVNLSDRLVNRVKSLRATGQLISKQGACEQRHSCSHWIGEVRLWRLKTPDVTHKHAWRLASPRVF
jgi:hypothetical protein